MISQRCYRYSGEPVADQRRTALIKVPTYNNLLQKYVMQLKIDPVIQIAVTYSFEMSTAFQTPGRKRVGR